MGLKQGARNVPNVTCSAKRSQGSPQNIIPDVVILNIRLSPAKGFWEVYLESGGKKGLLYVDFPKKHFFSGPLVSIREKKNLTQERFIELNKVDVSQIPLENALSWVTQRREFG